MASQITHVKVGDGLMFRHSNPNEVVMWKCDEPFVVLVADVTDDITVVLSGPIIEGRRCLVSALDLLPADLPDLWPRLTDIEDEG